MRYPPIFYLLNVDEPFWEKPCYNKGVRGNPTASKPMAVYHLTNRESNITFRIADTATVITMEVCRWAKPDIQHMDVDAARKMYSLARKFGFEKGYTRHQSMRKITTNAQYAEWVKKTFDFYNNDNDAEAELAMQEMFVGQGYIEVLA